MLKTCLFGYFPILKLLLFWSFLVFSTWFEADLAGSHSILLLFVSFQVSILRTQGCVALKNKVVIPQKHLYNTGSYNLQPPWTWNTKRNDHFKYLYIYVYMYIYIYNLAPTTQSNSGLLGKISHDNLWSNWKNVYYPQQKDTWKSPPKNPYSRWLGFCIFDDHLEACFSPHQHHQASEKRFPNFKKNLPFGHWNSPHWLLKKNVLIVTIFLWYFLLPPKRIYFELVRFFLKYRRFHGKQRPSSFKLSVLPGQ